jgi:hypothetical protein
MREPRSVHVTVPADVSDINRAAFDAPVNSSDELMQERGSSSIFRGRCPVAA